MCFPYHWCVYSKIKMNKNCACLQWAMHMNAREIYFIGMTHPIRFKIQKFQRNTPHHFYIMHHTSGSFWLSQWWVGSCTKANMLRIKPFSAIQHPTLFFLNAKQHNKRYWWWWWRWWSQLTIRGIIWKEKISLWYSSSIIPFRPFAFIWC